MGVWFNLRKSGDAMDVYVGRGIPDKGPTESLGRFDGRRLVGASGKQTYSHFVMAKEGERFVLRSRGMRAAGQEGKSSIRAGHRRNGRALDSALLRDAKASQMAGVRLKASLDTWPRDLASSRVLTARLAAASKEMAKQASRSRAPSSPKAASALGGWRRAAGSAERLAKAAAGANEKAVRLSSAATEAAAKAAVAQAELDAKLAAATAEQASKAAAKAAEEAAKQAARAAEGLGRGAAKAAEAATRATLVATEMTAKAMAAATEATVRAAVYTAAAAAGAVASAFDS